MQLARWLTGREHPLTLRVIVNRIWQHHFGEGIVTTENDFGVMGAAPTHPQLLDWLAAELMEHGWQLKPLHRLIVLSNTYQMASTGNDTAERLDPENHLLWRYQPRRLEAEAIRDSVLAISGELNGVVGGPSIYPHLAQAVLETQSRPGDGWGKSTPTEAARRSVYICVKRTLLVPELEVLDFPSTESTCEQRTVSTVAPQALTFMNGEFMNEQARALARRLTAESTDDSSRIASAFRWALCRDPNDEEIKAAQEFLEHNRRQIEADLQAAAPAADGSAAPKSASFESFAALCLVLLNTNDMAYVR